MAHAICRVLKVRASEGCYSRIAWSSEAIHAAARPFNFLKRQVGGRHAFACYERGYLRCQCIHGRYRDQCRRRTLQLVDGGTAGQRGQGRTVRTDTVLPDRLCGRERAGEREAVAGGCGGRRTQRHHDRPARSALRTTPSPTAHSSAEGRYRSRARYRSRTTVSCSSTSCRSSNGASSRSCASRSKTDMLQSAARDFRSTTHRSSCSSRR